MNTMFLRKQIQHSNFFKVVAIVLLVLSLSNIDSNVDMFNLRDAINDSFPISEISDPPNSSITINILGAMFGNQIEAKLSYGFRYDNSSMTYAIGFSQKYLKIDNSIIFARASGLGYDEMRDYPFAYTDSGMITDYWLNHTPSWTSRRKYAAWTPLAAFGGYLGPITEENMTHLTKAGDIVEFENLTIYFDDGTSFLCGPRLITLGVNFTQQDGEWQTEYFLESSDLQNIIIEESELTIYLPKIDPVSIPFVMGLSFTGIVAFVLLFKLYKRRLTRLE